MNPTDCERRGELRDKVARGVAWNMAEKIGTALMQMAVSLIILRLLTRADLGLMAILTAVSAVALVIVDSGFSQTLIRKPNPQRNEFTTVFLFNIGVSLVLYTLFVAVAPAASRYYDMPELVQLAPVFFLLLPVNALCAVQNAIFTRQFRFALLSKVTFVSWLVSGLTAIGLALAGCGVWSIVAQRVLQMAVRAVLL
ncbi:MAG: oligosaccharide flippase family protein, partial [Bacteroides cellulosilyticus]|nr:oligosaccharide flippase family protein [Bacteroides cellulosilyticus]